MMKHVRLPGLIAITAMALMALFGAGTASATVLCKTTTNPCGEAWKFSGTVKGTLASGTSAVMKDTSGTTQGTCTGGAAEGSVSAGGEGSPVTGSTSSLSLSGCSSTTDVIKGCKGEIQSISGTSSGTAIVSGCEVTTSLFGVSCVYGPGSGIEGVVEEGGSGEAAKVSKVVNKQAGGFLCPSTTVIEASVVRTTPEGTLGVAPS